MKDLESISKELEKSGKSEKLKSLASSKEGEAVSRMINAAEVERAAKAGDMTALKSILSQVLSTDEGKALAENVRKAMK